MNLICLRYFFSLEHLKSIGKLFLPLFSLFLYFWLLLKVKLWRYLWKIFASQTTKSKKQFNASWFWFTFGCHALYCKDGFVIPTSGFLYFRNVRPKSRFYLKLFSKEKLGGDLEKMIPVFPSACGKSLINFSSFILTINESCCLVVHKSKRPFSKSHSNGQKF
jgi:hypothetical protein